MWTRELRRRKGRTIATGVAVAVATALLVSMLAISDGIIATVEEQIAQSEADVLVAAPYDTNFPGGRAIAATIENYTEVASATPTLQAVISLHSATGSESPAALGVVPGPFFELLPARDQALFSGWFSDGGDVHFAGNYSGAWTGEVVLSRELADSLTVAVGANVEASPRVGDPARTFRVVGIADLQLSPERVIQDVRLAFFRLSELQDLSGEAFEGPGGAGPVADRVSRIYVSLTPQARVAPEGARAIAQRIESEYPDFAGMVSTKQDRLDRLQDEYQVGRIFYAVIGLVALFIGLLFVGCIVAVSVSERTRDIGALRAMGVSRRSVFLMVLTESCLVVVAGALAGIAPAYLSAQALGGYVASSQGVAPTLIAFNAELVAVAVLEVVAFGAAVSLYPAWRAMRVPVVEALASRA